eukprot:4806261-Pleurochrysis_carterae.AAC.1
MQICLSRSYSPHLPLSCQRSLSAFAAASLWVVVGVSADNIFVVHETWRQSALLVDEHGHAVDGAVRGAC